MTNLTPAEIKAVQAKIEILKGFTSEYADEMIALYTKLLELDA
jgi:hypothetical protein